MRGFELLVVRVLRVAEHEDHLARLAGFETQAHVMVADRGPAVRDRAGEVAALDRERRVPAAVRPEERLALGLEALDRLGAGEVREVVAPLPVLGLVVDDAAVHLDLAGGEVALVVGGVVLRVPETELDRGEEREIGGGVALVRHRRAPDLEGLAQRDEVEGLGANPVQGRGDSRVRHPVPALVVVQLTPGRLPGRRPVVTGRVVTQVEVAAADVERRVVVAVPGQPAQPGVAVERIAARGVRDQPEVLLGAQVVDPGQRGVGSLDDVLTGLIVEVAVTHYASPPCGSAPIT